ncbi:hypothetical protein P4H61_02020 [Paenibacillus peoriae]|uniref:hypothetical protein n=1 Tax=Paenibacillus peoriae TaxID=59893 RepID=UPI00026C5E04|nr:hypothetical protein [Paenibacillus peoriae]MEC0180277.1 hypothetical protein [Paenibacillus peoriae]
MFNHCHAAVYFLMGVWPTLRDQVANLFENAPKLIKSLVILLYMCAKIVIRKVYHLFVKCRVEDIME